MFCVWLSYFQSERYCFPYQISAWLSLQSCLNWPWLSSKHGFGTNNLWTSDRTLHRSGKQTGTQGWVDTHWKTWNSMKTLVQYYEWAWWGSRCLVTGPPSAALTHCGGIQGDPATTQNQGTCHTGEPVEQGARNIHTVPGGGGLGKAAGTLCMIHNDQHMDGNAKCPCKHVGHPIWETAVQQAYITFSHV